MLAACSRPSKVVGDLAWRFFLIISNDNSDNTKLTCSFHCYSFAVNSAGEFRVKTPSRICVDR